MQFNPHLPTTLRYLAIEIEIAFGNYESWLQFKQIKFSDFGAFCFCRMNF